MEAWHGLDHLEYLLLISVRCDNCVSDDMLSLTHNIDKLVIQVIETAVDHVGLVLGLCHGRTDHH